MVQEIAIDLPVPHTENCNHMDSKTLKKLRRHIVRTGEYEPLTVRPHPYEKGKFQVINGHQRLRVLRALGRPEASCTVWGMDDNQARLYLATLNGLSGTDIPERRALLLEELLDRLGVDELAAMLPHGAKHLEQLQQLARIELDDSVEPAAGTTNSEIPVILDFMLDSAEAKEVGLALDLAISAEGGSISRGQALVRIARSYLERCRVT